MSFVEKIRRLLAKICVVTVFVVNGFGNISWAAIMDPEWKGDYHNCVANPECLDAIYEFFEAEEEYFEKTVRIRKSRCTRRFFVYATCSMKILPSI